MLVRKYQSAGDFGKMCFMGNESHEKPVWNSPVQWKKQGRILAD